LTPTSRSNSARGYLRVISRKNPARTTSRTRTEKPLTGWTPGVRAVAVIHGYGRMSGDDEQVGTASAI
jgi:hypothetical protein